MKHRGLKFLSLLLTLVMVLGMLPGMTAFADTESVYLVGETIETDNMRFYIAQYASGNPKKVYTGTSIYKGLGTAPSVSSATNARVDIAAGGIGYATESSFVRDENEESNRNRTPIGVRIDSQVHLPGTEPDQIAVVLALVYGFTVTYDPGEGSLNTEAVGSKKIIDGKLVDVIETDNVSFDYQIQGYDSYFNAPEGKVFDCWKDANGVEYRAPQKVNLTANLTLTAQWKDEEKPDDGKKKTGGSGSFDLVFNIPGVDNTWEYVGGYAPQQAYRVSLAPMQGGSAALGLTTGESGETLNVYPSTTVYVFPEAEQGYTLDKIVWSLIDGSASYDITEAKTFVMPAMDVVVYVTFRPVG